MLNRSIALLLLCVAGSFLLSGLTPRGVSADGPAGAKLYSTYCGACHGEAGKGAFGPAVGTEKYLSEHSDDALTAAIADGTTGKGMPAWGQARGGSLSDDQIADIVAYLRSLAPASAPNVPVAAPPPAPPVTASLRQTRLSLKQSNGAQGETLVTATLLDPDKPVSGVKIVLTRPTTFGTIQVGSRKTDSRGEASFTLPALPGNAREVVAAFAGDSTLSASTGRVTLEPPAVETNSTAANYNPRDVRLTVEEPVLVTDGSLISPKPPLGLVAILAVVVGGIWAIFGLVFSQIAGIWKEGRSPARRKATTPAMR
jgi:mono/diheme cytochrome c family protein